MLDRPPAFTLAAALAGLALFTGCARDAPPEDEAGVAGETAADAAPATEPELTFDYPGSWLDDGRCVDICGVTPESPVERPAAVRCFDDDPDCLHIQIEA
ncbi:MAG: hypothetical protein AAFX50_20575, partial [Acidobacteriota bacterium]